ncbi:unnamed protein product [Allacma fusca]|uniref:Uncharacterized protein n=1 Tax=Allacma fusca TaxID=39272 RepID=A0A8J2JBS5_9HEXA|nr:unnamed protein product [Allacma fusca]
MVPEESFSIRFKRPGKLSESDKVLKGELFSEKFAATMYSLVKSCLPAEITRMWERNRCRWKTSDEKSYFCDKGHFSQDCFQAPKMKLQDKRKLDKRRGFRSWVYFGISGKMF